MLIAHGTTELNADKIESTGFFNLGTYFLKLSPDRKLGLFGSVCFALRDHSLTNSFVDLYTSQDLIIRIVRKELRKIGKEYIEEKKERENCSPGLVYIIDAPENVLDYHKGLRSFAIPNELFSTERISTSTIKKIVCLEEHSQLFSRRYEYPIEVLDRLTNDSLPVRLYYTASSRFQRLIIGRK